MDDKKPKKPLTKQQKQDMIQPYTPKYGPCNLELVPGKEYLYCRCGLSTTFPFCDGVSHIDTPFEPLAFKAKNTKFTSLCGCRRNSQSAGPFCDGRHSDPNTQW